MNDFVNVLRFSKDIKLAMRPRAYNFLVVLLQREETCLSKVSSASIMIPRKELELLNLKVNVTFLDWLLDDYISISGKVCLK